MNAHVVETVIPESEDINIKCLPFQPGTSVAVIVIERPASRPATNLRTFSYRGLPHRYDAPCEPAVPPEEWEAIGESHNPINPENPVSKTRDMTSGTGLQFWTGLKDDQDFTG